VHFMLALVLSVFGVFCKLGFVFQILANVLAGKSLQNYLFL